MGCRTEPASVHIAHVLQKLHFFQFFNFFLTLHDFPQKRLRALTAKIKEFNFFFIIHATYRKKKLKAFIVGKKISRLDDLFCTRLTFFTGYLATRPTCEPPLDDSSLL